MSVGIDGGARRHPPRSRCPDFRSGPPKGVRLERRLIRAISEGFESNVLGQVPGERVLDPAVLGDGRCTVRHMFGGQSCVVGAEAVADYVVSGPAS